MTEYQEQLKQQVIGKKIVDIIFDPQEPDAVVSIILDRGRLDLYGCIQVDCGDVVAEYKDNS